MCQIFERRTQRVPRRRERIDLARSGRRQIKPTNKTGRFEVTHPLGQNIGADRRQGGAQVGKAQMAVLEPQENLQNPPPFQQTQRIARRDYPG